MQYDVDFFDAGIERRGTDCEKWDDRTVMPEGAVPLWVADMDFRSAEPIERALTRRAAHACYGYTMTTARDFDAMLSFMERRHGVRLSADDCLLLPCVVTGLKLFVRCFSEPGDRVAMLTPVYGPFRGAIELNGREAVRVPLLRGSDLRYSIDFNRLEEVFRSGVRMLLICSPHNPVSRCWTRDELTALLRLCRSYGVRLCVDEIHAEFVFRPQTFCSVMALAEPDDEVVSFVSASKAFNIAGLQQAYALSRRADMLKRIDQEIAAAGVVSGNIFALEATRAAWQEGEPWLDGLMDYLDRNRGILSRFVREELPFAKLTPVEATYLAWLDLSAYESTCERLVERCARAGVVFTEGTFFGPEGEGFMRVNFGCPAAQLKDGLKRLRKALS